MASAGQNTEQARQAEDVDAIPTLAWSARQTARLNSHARPTQSNHESPRSSVDSSKDGSKIAEEVAQVGQPPVASKSVQSFRFDRVFRGAAGRGCVSCFPVVGRRH